MEEVSPMTPADPAQPSPLSPDSLRPLILGFHSFLILLVALGAVRGFSGASLAAGAVLVAVYLAGFAARGRSRRVTGLWIGSVIGVWAIITLAVSVNFAWVAFALFFLPLFHFPVPVGIVGVAVTAGVASVALVLDDGFGLAKVAGPTVGAIAAVLFALSYRALAHENARNRALLAALTETQERLTESDRARGALDERRRVAREVHDTIAQGLSSIILLARAAQLTPGDEHNKLGQIGELAQQNLGEARRIVEALSPSDLEAATLPDAVRGIVGSAGSLSGIETGFSVVGETRTLPNSHEAALLRVAQSAVANAVAHSGARSIHVTLTSLDDRTVLDVVDDGRGFDRERLGRATSGFGLTVMEDRMDQVGGVLVVESVVGEGTAVSASIPLGAQ